MRKALLLLFSLYSLIFISCNRGEIDYKQPDLYQEAAQTLEDYDLVGQVKRVQEIGIGIGEVPNLKIYGWKSKLGQSNVFNFDNKKRLIGRNVKVDTNELDGRYNFYYDKNDLLFQSKAGYKTSNYTYNEKHQLVEIKKENNRGRTKFIHGKHDKTGNTFVTIEKYYFKSYNQEKLEKREIYEFDQQGRTITYKKDNERTYISYHGNTVVDSTSTYGGTKYFKKAKFKKGHLINLSNYKYTNALKTEEVLLEETKYSYNRKGHLVSEEHIDTDDDATNYHHTYEYQYDSEGNWIVQKVYVNDKPSQTYIRKITYYRKRFIGILK